MSSPIDAAQAQQPGGFAEDARQSLMPLPAATALEALQSRGFSKAEVHELVLPRRTLARRLKDSAELTLPETDRARRLARIADLADRVFGSHDKAQQWLRSESVALDGARPIDFLVSESGAHEIEMELHRIDYGILA